MKHIKPEVPTNQKPFSMGIVVSQFNSAVTHELLQGALKRLTACGFTTSDITVVEVPGAVEVPIVIKRLAKTQQFEALIAFAAVIRGETTHYDYVCDQVSQGCQRVALDFDIPVIFGVLTTENEEQAWDRLGGKHGHKGEEAADCALAMQSVLRQIS
jgi:6,7-dimethyl-8-ribityllumazine synthase